MPAASPARRPKAGTSKAAAADRRRLFVRAYIANGRNGTQAAIDAGFSPRSARGQAARLLADVNISRELAVAAHRGLEAADLTVQRTLRELARIAFADPRKLYRNGQLIPVDELDDETAAAVSSIEVDDSGKTKVRLHGKNEALTSALRHLGLFERDNRQGAENFSLEVVIVGTDGSREVRSPPPVKPAPRIELTPISSRITD
jgi:phage terminase small subunit